ncbi:MAG: imidazole glycerol phosphate synthase subunit HisH [Lachnospiraceae bacterium]|nr:imidazole glycerol phosphate synthase subunit HisH [Lachnospiraceae bacterium]
MIAIIDYDAGNIKSVEKAMTYLGQEALITRDHDTLLHADKVILPGVGAFGDAMEKLREYGLVSVIEQIVSKDTPFLGICLGLQLLFEESEETPGIAGLGLLPGRIERIPDCPGLKIPHMGWNSIEIRPDSRLFQNVPNQSYVYFVHSYYLRAKNPEDVVATTEYSTQIHASVEHNNIFACQFHPEKSSTVGLQILKNFIELKEDF